MSVIVQEGDVVRVVTKVEIRFEVDVIQDIELTVVETIIGEWRSDLQKDLRRQLLDAGLERVIVNVKSGV